MGRKAYTVEARRSGGWWALEVSELRGVHSQVRRLEQAEDMIRDAIALALDVDPQSFDIEDVIPIIHPDVDRKFREAKEARVAAEEARQRASATTADAVRAANDAGLPVRDTAKLLGVSFQRVAKVAAWKQDKPRKGAQR